MKTVLMRAYSLCQKLKHKLEQTTEQKMRKGLKCSDSVFICKVFKITVFQMLMATTVLPKDPLI